MNDSLSRVLKVVFFLFCMFLIVFGQQTVGKVYLLLQLIGLAGLLFLLWNYNRKFI
ncbi:hypothetical protein KFZ56_07235 [Virgibacillus sp. NKC19-3]|uniref:DUF6903 family protein n=1 Tax=Virgibacillus saliphilus TaxID=2831674 RepID=UPI001C9B1028|nr:hypothetical protein [Virgibacillus sp. NKC19-3]MBY7142854.1 hypothetical protein [Virgibacillus sp. NKC19-3]